MAKTMDMNILGVNHRQKRAIVSVPFAALDDMVDDKIADMAIARANDPNAKYIDQEEMKKRLGL